MGIRLEEHASNGVEPNRTALPNHWFRIVADRLPSMCLLADEDGDVLWANERWFDWVGLSPEDLHGDAQDRMGEVGKAALAAWGEVISGASPRQMIVSLPRADGTTQSLALRSETIVEDGRALCRMVTASPSEENISFERDQTFRLALSDRLRRENDPDVILARTAEAIGVHLGVSRVNYGEVDPTGEWMTVPQDWSDGLESAAGTYRVADFGPQVMAEHSAGLTFRTDDIESDDRFVGVNRMIYRQVGVAAFVTVPLIKKGRLTAILSIQQKHARAWTAAEIALLEDVAERTWATLERARAQNSLLEAKRSQTFLLELADTLRRETEAAVILEKAVEAVGRHLQVSRVGYAEVDASGDWLTIETNWTDGSVGDIRGRYPLISFGKHVVATLQGSTTVRVADWTDDPLVDDDSRPALAAMNIEAAVTVPLVRGGKLIAVLSIHQNRPRNWSDAEVELLEDVANRTWAIVERARAEAELRASQALLSTFMENAPVGMYLKDADRRYTLVNTEMGKVLGVPPVDAIGKTARELLGEDEARRIKEEETRALATGAPQAREQIFPDRNQHASALVIRFPVVVEAGAGPRIGGFAIDTTERKRAETELARSREALYQSEKLTALGSLLAGVSHELNNPLSIVVAHAMMLEAQAQDTPVAARALKIRTAAERCARIVQTFLAMARQKAPERRSVGANAAVRSALELADHDLDAVGVTTILDLAEGLPPLWADADQLNQVLTNLIVNAQQALQHQRGERRLSISTRRGSRADEVEIEVADNGPGVPAELRRRIFEPFFTSKAQEGGTGLGLSFSLGLVEAHGGTLELVDAARGAVFRLLMPARRRVDSTRMDHAPVATVPHDTSGSALVIDDEPEVAEALSELLANEGYRVTIACGGEEGRDCLRSEEFDLVLSDLKMPDVDGAALFAWIQRDRPDLVERVAFVTGDTFGDAAASFLARTGRPFIEKPFTPQAIRQLLSAIR